MGNFIGITVLTVAIAPVAEDKWIRSFIIPIQLVRTEVLVFIVVIVLVMADQDLPPVYNTTSVFVLGHPFSALCTEPAGYASDVETFQTASNLHAVDEILNDEVLLLALMQNT